MPICSPNHCRRRRVQRDDHRSPLPSRQCPVRTLWQSSTATPGRNSTPPWCSGLAASVLAGSYLAGARGPGAQPNGSAGCDHRNAPFPRLSEPTSERRTWWCQGTGFKPVLATLKGWWGPSDRASQSGAAGRIRTCASRFGPTEPRSWRGSQKPVAAVRPDPLRPASERLSRARWTDGSRGRVTPGRVGVVLVERLVLSSACASDSSLSRFSRSRRGPPRALVDDPPHLVVDELLRFRSRPRRAGQERSRPPGMTAIGPIVGLIPQRPTICRAIPVSCWMSDSAPVLISPNTISSAARPPSATLIFATGPLAVVEAVGVGRGERHAERQPRGMIETLRTGSAPGVSIPTIAWPPSWYAVRRRSSALIITCRSAPSTILSSASVKSAPSTSSWSRRAAVSAASLTSSRGRRRPCPASWTRSGRVDVVPSGTLGVCTSRIGWRPRGRRLDGHPAVEAAGTQQRRVEHVGPVRRGEDDDAGRGSKPSISVRIWFSVCSRSSLPPPKPACPRARAADRVQLVDEHDRRSGSSSPG